MLKQKYGRFIGYGQLIFWIIVLPWMIITIPLNLYYTQTKNKPPSWLESIYRIEFFNFDWGIVIISTFWMVLIGIGLIWVGWHHMHPITHKKLKEDNLKYNRLEIVEKFSKEDYLAQIRAEAREFREEQMKKRKKKKKKKKGKEQKEEIKTEKLKYFSRKTRIFLNFLNFLNNNDSG